MILIIYAHPYPHHSHANKRMLEQAGTLENVEIRSLYHLYPDFNIDVAAEQEALSRASLIVWQHPMQSQPLQATALYCGLKWLSPFAMHCTFICDDDTLQAQARQYKQRL